MYLYSKNNLLVFITKMLARVLAIESISSPAPEHTYGKAHVISLSVHDG